MVSTDWARERPADSEPDISCRVSGRAALNFLHPLLPRRPQVEPRARTAPSGHEEQADDEVASADEDAEQAGGHDDRPRAAAATPRTGIRCPAASSLPAIRSSSDLFRFSTESAAPRNWAKVSSEPRAPLACWGAGPVARPAYMATRSSAVSSRLPRPVSRAPRKTSRPRPISATAAHLPQEGSSSPRSADGRVTSAAATALSRTGANTSALRSPEAVGRVTATVPSRRPRRAGRR